MAVNGPPRAAGGRVAAARRGRCPAPLRCIEGVYSRYCKAGATLAGIGVRAGQEPFRGSATHNRSSLAGAQIALICTAARLHRLDPAAAHNGGYRVKRQAQYVTVRGRTRCPVHAAEQTVRPGHVTP